jgi:hypothetical protein
MACTVCLVCFISSVNAHCNKKKEEAYPWKAGASSGHITKLKQSIMETFDIYALYKHWAKHPHLLSNHPRSHEGKS